MKRNGREVFLYTGPGGALPIQDLRVHGMKVTRTARKDDLIDSAKVAVCQAIIEGKTWAEVSRDQEVSIEFIRRLTSRLSLSAEMERRGLRVRLAKKRLAECEHDSVIALRAAGISGKEVALWHNVTPETVSRIWSKNERAQGASARTKINCQEV